MLSRSNYDSSYFIYFFLFFMSNNPEVLDGVIDRVDSIVKPFYKSDMVACVEKLSIYTSLVGMEWHKKVTEAIRKHFDILTKVFGYIAIIGSILGILTIFSLFGFLSAFGMGYGIYIALSIVVSIALGLVGVVGGLGLLGKKEWVPFLVIVQMVLNFGSQIVLKIAEAVIPKTTTLTLFGTQVSTTTTTTSIGASWVISTVIGLAIGFVFLSFIIKVKDLFGKK